jgi:hypothetical protein
MGNGSGFLANMMIRAFLPSYLGRQGVNGNPLSQNLSESNPFDFNQSCTPETGEDTGQSGMMNMLFQMLQQCFLMQLLKTLIQCMSQNPSCNGLQQGNNPFLPGGGNTRYGYSAQNACPSYMSGESSNGDVSGSDTGCRLADAAERVPGEMCSRGGHCYHGVKMALNSIGVNLAGSSAYMAADQLAGNSQFREVSVSCQQLPSLPRGAVVVWGRQGNHPDGHISIADGRGNEYSDKVRRQMTNYGQSYRVFIPTDSSTAMV